MREKNYGTNGTLSIQAGDFTVGPDAVTVNSINMISGTNNTQYIFNLSASLDQNQIVDNNIRCNTNSVEDIFNNSMNETTTYPLSYIGINFFVDMAMEDFIHNENGWQATNFDGSDRINAEGIKVRARVLPVTSFAGSRPVLYYDVLNTHSQNSFWYPNENNEARMVAGVNMGNNIWEFTIPSSDDELKSGNELSFILRFGSLFCYRSKYDINDGRFSPQYAETFMIKIQKILMQNNNVTILNNVINPNHNEITKLVYVLEKSGPVSIVVYDLAGDLVCVLRQGSEAKGQHIVTWNGRNNNGRTVARGVYFIRVRAPGIFNQIRKVLIVK